MVARYCSTKLATACVLLLLSIPKLAQALPKPGCFSQGKTKACVAVAQQRPSTKSASPLPSSSIQSIVPQKHKPEPFSHNSHTVTSSSSWLPPPTVKVDNIHAQRTSPSLNPSSTPSPRTSPPDSPHHNEHSPKSSKLEAKPSAPPPFNLLAATKALPDDVHGVISNHLHHTSSHAANFAAVSETLKAKKLASERELNFSTLEHHFVHENRRPFTPMEKKAFVKQRDAHGKEMIEAALKHREAETRLAVGLMARDKWVTKVEKALGRPRPGVESWPTDKGKGPWTLESAKALQRRTGIRWK